MPVWESFTNQEQWRDFLRNLVKTNDRALKRAIVLIYNNQTLEEKDWGVSIDRNNTGFDKIDAYEMGRIARKIENSKPLTKGELAKSRNKMRKYWKQLMIISKKKAELKRNYEEAQEMAESFEERYKENEVLLKCEEGVSCEYGICSECPVSVYENGGGVR